MHHRKDNEMGIDDFDFSLPPKFIAKRPKKPRDSSKLLVISDTFSNYNFKKLPDLLQPSDLIILNNTKVIQGQLQGTVDGKKITITLIKKRNQSQWEILAKPAKKLRSSNQIRFAKDFSAEIIKKISDGRIMLRFNVADRALDGLLAKYGRMPIPPYIQKFRQPDIKDKTDYQTTYAKNLGSVASPTAGLHFTKQLIKKLKEKKIDFAEITLHVGAGTFLPIRCKNINQHQMHGETGYISKHVAKKINQAKKEGRRIIAVVTTSLRLLETATDSSGKIHPFLGETNIFIKPPYKFKCVDLLLTNFHLPKSTLFILVCAFAGIKKMKEAYEYAKIKNYRFFSYGDGNLIYRKES